eukprot:GHVN01012300.1.p1 GENE.GHVN01012300.1~~GHVN01012300.1.p1  ORF type:complete len:184 (+),score=35.49 GHVN01012300.1:781-1332(+)
MTGVTMTRESMMSQAKRWIVALLCEQQMPQHKLMCTDAPNRSGVVMRMVKETKQWPANSVRVIKLKRNRGKGFSVRLGMLASRGHYVLMMDADGASRFEDMVSLERGLVPKLSTVSAKEERRKREVKDNIGEEGEGESTLESGDNGTQKSKFYERSKKHFKALFIDTDRCKFILCEFTFNETV